MAAHQAPLSLGFSRQEHWSGLPLPSPMHESEKWKWSRSVVSDPQRPHGLQPSRLLCPWDFPGKSTGVGCHCLLLPYLLRKMEKPIVWGERVNRGKQTSVSVKCLVKLLLSKIFRDEKHLKYLLQDVYARIVNCNIVYKLETISMSQNRMLVKL